MTEQSRAEFEALCKENNVQNGIQRTTAYVFWQASEARFAGQLAQAKALVEELVETLKHIKRGWGPTGELDQAIARAEAWLRGV